MTADLVVLGGRIHTLDPVATVAEAFAVRDGRVLAVGAAADIEMLAGPGTRRVELAGASVVPGINDAHLHLSMLGLAMPPHVIELDSTAVSRLSDVRGAVAAGVERAAAHDWVQGSGWRESDIAEFADRTRHPNRSDLDPVSGDQPVALRHFSAHSAWVNTAALRAAGITRSTPDPEGGIIVRDGDGEPTGLLLENAAQLVFRQIPPPSADKRRGAMRDAMRLLNSYGITSVTDPLVTPDVLRDYLALHRNGELTVRVHALLHWTWPSLAAPLDTVQAALAASGLASGLGDDTFRILGAKVFADGIPSQRTAWTYQPYEHDCVGSLVTPGHGDAEQYQNLLELVELLHRQGLLVQIHATGDRAVDAALDAIVRARESDPGFSPRHAILHGTLIADASVARLAEHGVGVVTSTVMKADLGPTMRPALGDRWERTFRVGSLLRAGVAVANSSDSPIVRPDWRRGVHAMVTGDQYGRHADQERVDRLAALRTWTTSAAYFEGTEHRKGSIRPGHLADFTILSDDPFGVEERDLVSLRVLATYVDGECVHRA